MTIAPSTSACYSRAMTHRATPPLRDYARSAAARYACGIFPMAESADDPTLFWVEPEMRGVIRSTAFASPRASRARFVPMPSQSPINTAFKAVIAGCAAPQPEPSATPGSTSASAISVWSLHQLGHCHSVEVWQNGRLVGGLYGVSLRARLLRRACFTAPATPRN